MQPEEKSFLTPKIFIIGGILVILLTIGLNYAYNYFQNTSDNNDTEQAEDLPGDKSEEVDYDSFTFSPEDQKYSIDYPKTVTMRELQKKYYRESKRLFEGKTEFISTKRNNDPEYFKLTINTQRIYRDNQDQVEALTNTLTPTRLCPKGDYKKQNHATEKINDFTYIVTRNVRGCSAAYTTYYETFTQPALYIFEIQSNQPFEKIKKYSDELLSSVYLDTTY